MTDDVVCVGAIMGAYGLRGEVRIKSFCGDPAAIGDYNPLQTKDGARQFNLAIIGQIKGGFNARIDGVTTKEDGDALRGIEIYAKRACLPNLPDDEFYHSDLIGLMALDTGGAVIGRVKAVLNHGADDLLEIALRGTGGKTALVPFTRAIVPTVDLGGGRIIIDPIDGLL